MIISIPEARRIAIAAQGFDRPRPSREVNIRDLRRTIHQLSLLQLDFVNVLVPSHFLVPFSRLGPYQRCLLEELVYQRREFTEQWAHEASIIPMQTWPLLRHRMEKHRIRPYGMESFLEKHPDYTSFVLNEVRARGPLASDDLPVPDGAERKVMHSWFGTIPRIVLEGHFGWGALAIARRRINFAREYDLAERIIPDQYFRTKVDREEAERLLLLSSAKSHGIGTAADLADYFRMPVKAARPRIQELVSAGKLREVSVEGWRETAFLHPEASVPSTILASSLLSPFDPLIWFRPRTSRLFHFDYRMEVFIPEAKRKWGIYVLPFLLNDRLVARVDLKADRINKKLSVLGAFSELNAPANTAGALKSEIQALAQWLGLPEIAIGRRGNFIRNLKSELIRK